MFQRFLLRMARRVVGLPQKHVVLVAGWLVVRLLWRSVIMRLIDYLFIATTEYICLSFVNRAGTGGRGGGILFICN